MMTLKQNLEFFRVPDSVLLHGDTKKLSLLHVASPAFVSPAVACIGLLPCDTPGSGAVGRGLQPEDAVVVFARSCGSVCNKPPTHTSRIIDESPPLLLMKLMLPLLSSNATTMMPMLALSPSHH